MLPLRNLLQPNSNDDKDKDDDDVSFEPEEFSLEDSLQDALDDRNIDLESAQSEFINDIADLEEKEDTVVLLGPSTMRRGSDEQEVIGSMESLMNVIEKREDIQFNVEDDIDEFENIEQTRFRNLFWGGALLVIGLFFLGDGLDWFRNVSITILSVWPLVLVIWGLYILSVRVWWSKTLNVAMVLVLVALAVGTFTGDRQILANASGIVIEENRDIESINRIVVSGDGNIVIVEGGEEELVVRGDENLISGVETLIQDGELRIVYNKPLIQKEENNMDIIVTVQNIDSLHLIGGGTILATSITTGELELFLNGNGKISLKVDVEIITSKIVGNGKIDLSGRADRQIVHVNGSGIYDASNLTSIEAGVRANGASEVRIAVDGELNAISSGGGRILYSGSPTLSLSEVSGGGTIRKIDTITDSAIEGDNILEQLKKLDEVKPFRFDEG